MNRFILFFLIQFFVAGSITGQSLSLELKYSTNKDFSVVKKRNYYNDYFVDSTIYKRNLANLPIYVDTFKVDKEGWQILKRGVWFNYISTNPKIKNFKYPAYEIMGMMVYFEHTIFKIHKFHGRTIIEFSVKEVGVESSEPLDQTVLFDLDIGAIQISQDEIVHKLTNTAISFNK